MGLDETHQEGIRALRSIGHLRMRSLREWRAEHHCEIFTLAQGKAERTLAEGHVDYLNDGFGCVIGIDA